ncbi:MAG TPA: flagellar hook-length control protein FliK, partial [Vicinamibacterales bacterium]
SPSVPGAAAPESVIPLPVTPLRVGRTFEAPEGRDWEQTLVPTASPTVVAERRVSAEAVPMMGSVEAPPEGDRAPRQGARGSLDRPPVAPLEQGQAQADAVQRVAAFVDMGLDLGSSARDGSREGAPPATIPFAAHVVLAGAAPTSTVVAPPTLTPSGQAAQANDVVLPQLVRAMRLQLVGGVGEARIQLDPKHLGAVTVNLRVEHGVVSAVVTAEQTAVRLLIENNELSLRQALSEQGLLLDKLHVERDGRSLEDRPSHGREGAPRRRPPRKDTATFELLA